MLSREVASWRQTVINDELYTTALIRYLIPLRGSLMTMNTYTKIFACIKFFT